MKYYRKHYQSMSGKKYSVLRRCDENNRWECYVPHMKRWYHCNQRLHKLNGEEIPEKEVFLKFI